MKISNSKKQLAKIIHENGGWRDGAEWAAQDKLGIQALADEVAFYEEKPQKPEGDGMWNAKAPSATVLDSFPSGGLLNNWHQTILSRDEYFHLYPVPDADGWIAWKGGEYPGGSGVAKRRDGVEVGFNETETRNWGRDFICKSLEIVAYRLHKPEQQKSTAVGDDETNLAAKEELEALEFEPIKPTIEQLAADYRNAKDFADRKQQEADAAKDDAEAKLAELVAAGKALGLVLSVTSPEPKRVLSVAPVQKYTGKFYNAELGEAPPYGKNTRDAVCDGCGKRYGEHYGDRCKSGSER